MFSAPLLRQMRDSDLGAGAVVLRGADEVVTFFDGSGLSSLASDVVTVCEVVSGPFLRGVRMRGVLRLAGELIVEAEEGGSLATVSADKAYAHISSLCRR